MFAAHLHAQSAVASFAGSAQFNGTAQLTVPYQTVQFGSGDYTVEFWAYITSHNTQWIQFLGQWGTFEIFQFSVLNDVVATQTSNGVRSSSCAYWTGSWKFLAYTRVSGVSYVYVNGTRYSLTGSDAGISATSSCALGIGRVVDQGGYGLIGNLNGLRITSGVARYTGTTMTVPTAPHPVGSIDPYWSSVQLLLPLDGDGTDRSSFARSVSNSGVTFSSLHP